MLGSLSPIIKHFCKLCYNHTMMMKKIKSILEGFEEVEFAYLFGSFTKGEATQRSDVDIAVYIAKGCDTLDTKLKIHHALEIALNKEIDLVSLSQAKNFKLLEDIFNQGVVLKESKDDARVMFELKKEHEILDYKEFKRMLNVA